MLARISLRLSILLQTFVFQIEFNAEKVAKKYF